MSIIRIKKEREYVSIANAILQDKALSWEARGVMAYLLSKPDGWECRNYDLVNQGPAGKHIIQRVMKELQGAGYIHRYQKSDGHKIEWVTEIYETPELNTTSRNTDIPPAEEPTVRKAAGRESGHIVSTDSQQVLNTEKTDFNGSAKNSQNQNGEDGFDRADQAERDNLNFIADQLARVTKIKIATANEGTIERLKKAALLGYHLAEYCQISLSKLKPRQINDRWQYSKALEDFLGDIIILNSDGVTPQDLMTNKKWWYNEYWLGRDKHQPPTSAQVCATWGQFEAAQSTPTSPAGPELSDVAKANYARLLAEQTK
jgi:hypothetical protein